MHRWYLLRGARNPVHGPRGRTNAAASRYRQNRNGVIYEAPPPASSTDFGERRGSLPRVAPALPCREALRDPVLDLRRASPDLLEEVVERFELFLPADNVDVGRGLNLPAPC